LDGQLKLIKNKRDFPQLFYNHKIQNLETLKKHYDDTYHDKMLYIQESIKTLTAKKSELPADKFILKMNKLKNKRVNLIDKYKRQHKLIATKLAQIKHTK
jgi:hypothetical protein